MDIRKIRECTRVPVFRVSQMLTYGMSDLLLLAVGSLVVFVLREYILKVHVLVSSEHKLCQI